MTYKDDNIKRLELLAEIITLLIDIKDARKDADLSEGDLQWYNRFSKVLREAKDFISSNKFLGNVVVTTNENGDAVAVTRQDNDGHILSVIWERDV